MPQNVNERVRAHRQRQADLRKKLHDQGFINIRLVVAEPASAPIERITQATADLYLKRPFEITDESFDEHQQDLLASFLQSGAPQMVEFKINGVGSMGIKMIPWRSTPVICHFPLNGISNNKTFYDQFPILSRISKFNHYHWRTPEYIEICADLGIDPFHGAPEFNIDYEAMAWSLLDWDNEGLSKFEKDGHIYYKIRNLLYDILDLMRTDKRKNITSSPPQILRNIMEIYDDMESRSFPYLKDIISILQNPAQLNISDAKSNIAAEITFLPSPFGVGYRASIDGWYGKHEPDGWVHEGNSRLHGVALLPSEERLQSQPWLKVVVERLRAQGVIFLSAEQADRYRDGEGAYWLWRHGWSGAASPTRRVLWSIRKPLTPIGDKSIELADAARLLRQ